MDYRKFLTDNADRIIANNQNIAIGNCSNVEPVLPDISFKSPILFKSIIENPSPYETPSDLKDSFLNKYIKISTMASPGIHYDDI